MTSFNYSSITSGGGSSSGISSTAVINALNLFATPVVATADTGLTVWTATGYP